MKSTKNLLNNEIPVHENTEIDEGNMEIIVENKNTLGNNNLSCWEVGECSKKNTWCEEIIDEDSTYDKQWLSTGLIELGPLRIGFVKPDVEGIQMKQSMGSVGEKGKEIEEERPRKKRLAPKMEKAVGDLSMKLQQVDLKRTRVETKEEGSQKRRKGGNKLLEWKLEISVFAEGLKKAEQKRKRGRGIRVTIVKKKIRRNQTASPNSAKVYITEVRQISEQFVFAEGGSNEKDETMAEGIDGWPKTAIKLP